MRIRGDLSSVALFRLGPDRSSSASRNPSMEFRSLTMEAALTCISAEGLQALYASISCRLG